MQRAQDERPQHQHVECPLQQVHIENVDISTF
jgi:hypothetical protein